jgi:hypothetical protein
LDLRIEKEIISGLEGVTFQIKELGVNLFFKKYLI